MTGLTLDEYKSISQKELRQKLQVEARLIFNPDSLENEGEKQLRTFVFFPTHRDSFIFTILGYNYNLF
jgi:hypothetical protein